MKKKEFKPGAIGDEEGRKEGKSATAAATAVASEQSIERSKPSGWLVSRLAV